MIQRFPFPQSPELQREIEAHHENVKPWTTELIRTTFPTAQDFVRDYEQSSEGRQLRKALRLIRPGAKIMDVGGGYGVVAIYLALQGYRVTVAEPSLDLCTHIERAATLYELPLEVLNVSAEYLNLAPSKSFNLCMFNASLHHCDDPQRALANCRNLLAPGGTLALLNEPLLQFFRSKHWLQQRISTGTLIVGDYGGNEHIYYFHEYRAMLARAGFTAITDFVAQRYRHPASYLRTLEFEKAKGMSFFLRRLYYGTIARLLRLGLVGKPILAVLKRLSLLQTNFLASAPP